VPTDVIPTARGRVVAGRPSPAVGPVRRLRVALLTHRWDGTVTASTRAGCGAGGDAVAAIRAALGFGDPPPRGDMPHPTRAGRAPGP